jgi:hypothetical protein
VRVAIILVAVLLLPIALPSAIAWRADGWLSQDIVGGERLRLGDEFGCHGMPDRDVRDGLDVVSDCKDYLTSNIHASKWGSQPLSFQVSRGAVSIEIHDTLFDAGFRTLGDGNLSGELDGLTPIMRSGGSLEKNVASTAAIEEGIAENGYANLYWEAQIEDLNVRRDKDVLAWIEDQPYWFTTWGEWYSAIHMADEIGSTSTSITLRGSPARDGGWAVPGTTVLSVQGANITDVVRVDGEPLLEIEEDTRHLEVGLRQLNDHAVIFTIPEGVEVRVEFDSEPTVLQKAAAPFNNMTPLMAVGHHTTDLFEWSEPFQHSPIRFTWLIEPQADVEPSWILPAIAVIVVLTVPTAVWWTMKKDREQYDEEE